MRINHNIAALNTHRQLNSASTAQSKSMEKLASGLRINRAGDDAAGLAISEKMRGQIRGLDQASKNSQDAISMIQTAEGALNETHDILQRMKELATQAANGTNTEDNRAEIQKEVNQLTSEINRIGNTTEFNTKKLLQGSNSKSDIGASAKAGAAGADAINASQSEWNIELSAKLADGESATITFKGVTINLSSSDLAGGAGGGGGATTNPSATSIDIALDSFDDLDTQLDNIIAGIQAQQAVAGSPLATFTFAENGGNDGIDISGDFGQGASNNSELVSISGDITFAAAATTHGADTAGVTGVAGVAQSYELTFDKSPTEGSTITVAGKDVAFFDSSKGNYADATDATKKLGADFVVDINGKNTSEIAAEVASLNFKGYDSGGTADLSGATAAAVGSKVTFTAETSGTLAADQAKVTTTDAYAGTKTSYVAGAVVNATSPDLSSKDFQMEIVVGDKAYTVDASALAIDLAGVDTFGSSKQTTVLDALKNAKAADGSKLSDVVNVSFDNNLINNEQTLNLEAKEVGTANIKTILTGDDAGDAAAVLGISEGVDDSVTQATAGTDAFKDGGKDFEETFQVGANQGQSFNISVKDMRSNALGLTGDSAGATSKDVEGAKYTTTKDVTNGTDGSEVEFALDVSTNESASAAIKVLDNAIQNVSGERSKLGAYQNRLDHTINNLNTSSENLTAAESRIRDVDMAKEMMEQTKNSILGQAAQAMLAQANQQPQGVLQLLR